MLTTATQRLARRTTRTRGRGLHAVALDRLVATRDPVLTIDLLKGSWRAEETPLVSGSRRVAIVRPHEHGILLGDPQLHRYSRIAITEHASGEVARAALSALDDGASQRAGLTRLWATPSAAFAGLSSVTGAGAQTPEDEPPFALPSDRAVIESPYIAEAAEHSASCVAAWNVLESDPQRHMVAFNLIRIPDPAAYKEFSSHFAGLPERYGMRFMSVAALDPDPAVSCLVGNAEAAEAASFDLMALVYFPSTDAFVQAWSDPDIQRAFPLRGPMREKGFRHLWLRCERETGAET